MYFELLHTRLVDHLRGRLRSGELTERSLARLAGISQPHLHNVLKGVRVLSAATADVVVMNLRLSVFDLLSQEELASPGRTAAGPRYREVPLAAGWLGPGHPFPDLQQDAGRLTLSAAELEGIEDAVAVRLAADPQAPAIFRAGDLVLLQVFSSGDAVLQPGAYYAIDAGGWGVLRRYDSGGTAAMGMVRARAVWIHRCL